MSELRKGLFCAMMLGDAPVSEIQRMLNEVKEMEEQVALIDYPNYQCISCSRLVASHTTCSNEDCALKGVTQRKENKKSCCGHHCCERESHE